MLDESIFRGPPPRPYKLGDARLYVPLDALKATLASLRRSGALESCVFWYGQRSGDEATVAAVLTPRQIMRARNYDVSASAFREMVELLDDGWKPLAQIHSHPGRSVEHSLYDDKMVSSHRALSIVFPYYGRWNGNWTDGTGIHEWQGDYWHLLEGPAAQARVRLVEGELTLVRDLRA